MWEREGERFLGEYRTLEKLGEGAERKRGERKENFNACTVGGVEDIGENSERYEKESGERVATEALMAREITHLC